MKKIIYYLIYGGWYLLSLLPFRVLYAFSDLLYFPLYYVGRYRRKVVRRNLVSSFPEKSKDEIVRIEKKYYSFFCDYIMETLKLMSITEKQMRRRMKFEGLEDVERALKEGKPCSLYLGHYCNWEWVSSLAMHFGKGKLCGQIYHPLENPVFDRLFMYIRGRFGATSISMEDTFRTIMDWQKSGIPNVVGYISDQVPGYGSMHYWPLFLNHDTPTYTGAERISRLVNATAYYLDIYRPKRGYYIGKFIKIADSSGEMPKFYLTEQYYRLLEKSIRRDPPYWLWSHNRWKRTREEFNQIFSEKERKRILSRP